MEARTDDRSNSKRGITLPGVITAIGNDDFHWGLLGFLQHTIGADHCAIFALNTESPINIGGVSSDGPDIAARQIALYLQNGYWRLDPSMKAAREKAKEARPQIIRMEVGGLPPSALRDLVYKRTQVGERLLLCGRASQQSLVLSILRSERHGRFELSALETLENMADILLAVTSKHVDVMARKNGLTHALSSIEVIQDTIARAPESLPRRELEVCARTLFGVSSLGIGLELGIGEDTVKTYRKRTYHRLGIATQRELLNWYIQRWSEPNELTH